MSSRITGAAEREQEPANAADTRDGSTLVAGAQVRAFSGAGVGGESLDTDFGSVFTGADGGFRLSLASGTLRERVCVLVFARAPGEVALEVSDAVLLV